MKTKIKILDNHAKNNFIYIAILLAFVYLSFNVLFLSNKVFASEITESKLIQLVNQERRGKGLSELTLNPVLYFAAKAKANDMISRNYFEHYSPYGKSPWDFIHNAGYDYQKAGENLAMDFVTSEGIHNAWMASSTHKANILKPTYEDIGIAVIKGEFDNKNTTIIVQMFAQPISENQFSPNSLITTIRNFILGF